MWDLRQRKKKHRKIIVSIYNIYVTINKIVCSFFFFFDLRSADQIDNIKNRNYSSVHNLNDNVTLYR